MSTVTPAARPEIVYPESDGQPMAENTLQYRWIVTIKEGLEGLFRERKDAFIAADLFWYPVEGCPEIRTAPDVMVVLGRPKGDRGSYMQWREDDVPPQVVFEVLSPGNRGPELIRKSRFYDQYGVQEYVVYDPDWNTLAIWTRNASGEVVEVARPDGWTSPLLGIRFDLSSGPELRICRPDGQRFLTVQEVMEERDTERLRAEAQRQRADRLAEQLRQLGIEPEA